MLKKKGQISSKVFIYIIMIIVVSTVLLLGYRTVMSLKEKGELTGLIQLKTSLKRDINSLSDEYGSAKVSVYNLPTTIGRVCVVDLEQIQVRGKISAGLKANWPIIADQIESGTEHNLFLFNKQGVYADSLNIGDLNIGGPGWICYRNEQGKFIMELEGTSTGAGLLEDFSDLAEFGEEPIELSIEDILNLQLILDTTESLDGVSVKLKIIRGTGDNILTDMYVIETKNSADNSDYTGKIQLVNSYITIPVPDCENVGNLDILDIDGNKVGTRILQDCLPLGDEWVAKYDLGEI